MKTLLKIAVMAISLVLMLLADLSILPISLVSEAQAILGTRRRTAVVAYSAGKAAASAEAASSQQAATAQQQSASAQPAPAAAAGQPLPVGTVVTALPAGCASKPVGGVEYYYCGGNYYKCACQGNNLVYVTAKPE